jgi:hypothetical protein
VLERLLRALQLELGLPRQHVQQRQVR